MGVDFGIRCVKRLKGKFERITEDDFPSLYTTASWEDSAPESVSCYFDIGGALDLFAIPEIDYSVMKYEAHPSTVDIKAICVRPISVIKKTFGFIFFERAGSSSPDAKSYSYFKPEFVRRSLVYFLESVAAEDERLPMYYELRTRGEHPFRTNWHQKQFILDGQEYRLEHGWGGCIAINANTIIDLSVMDIIEGVKPETGEKIVLEITKQPYSERYVFMGTWLRRMIKVCDTAINHGWWVETYIG